MSKIFHFEAKILSEYFIFLFSGPEQVTHEEISDFIQNKQHGYVLPRSVVVLQALPHKSKIDEQLRARNSDLKSAFERGARSTSYSIAYFDESGQINDISIIFGRSGKRALVRTLQSGMEAVRKAGLDKIKKENEPLSKAPQGFLFSKPSSRNSNYFIRAENLLSEIPNSLFIAFCCLGFLSSFEDSKNAPASAIFIDTMGIAPIAFSILFFKKIFNPARPAAEVISFHSHDGLTDSKVDLSAAQSSICIISASTQCALAERWIEKTHTRGDQILTLISFEKESDHTSILLNIKKPEDYSVEGVAPPEEEFKLIRLQGERFQLAHSHPKALNISTKHAPDALALAFQNFHAKQMFSCFSRDPASSKTRAVHLNSMALMADGLFTGWFEKKIKESVPASLTRIFHDDDESSTRLAERARALLGDNYSSVPLVSFCNFEETASFTGSALVVTCVAERGSKLLNISRKLRTAQVSDSGTRIYLIGAILGKSIAHIDDIKANLKQPPKDSEYYKVTSYLEIPTGNHYSTAHWESELDVLRGMQLGGDLPDLLNERAELISNAPPSGLGDNAFYPSSYNQQPLRLRNGFAFAENATNTTSCSAGDVFLTISWILQHARQSSRVPEALKLSSNELRQVVISPDIFSRYNDGIIQACILRAANPSELDYRASKDLSEFMREICLRILCGYETERGEAALEFALALATKKIKLDSESERALKLAVNSNFQGRPDIPVLKFLNFERPPI